MSALLHFNGINGVTGNPFTPPVSLKSLAAGIACEQNASPNTLKTLLKNLFDRYVKKQLGVREGYDETNVQEVGWGVIYHPNTPPEIQNALASLVDHRNGKTFNYDPSESAYEFRRRHGQGYGPVDPEKLPYYLMVVGPPNEIPFDFQYDLDVEHAVGRLSLETPDDYCNYANKVIAYENTMQADRERMAAFFSPVHENDPVIRQTAEKLATPLNNKYNGMKLNTMAAGTVVYRTEHKNGDQANRDGLLDFLTRSKNKPSLLFTASHGLGFPKGHARQKKEQGALICNEYPGSEAKFKGEIPPSMYLAGSHITPDIDLTGLCVFVYACFSAGTPKRDAYAKIPGLSSGELAETAFVSNLSQQLLSRGALSFIGHVERTWSYSYGWPGIGFLTGTFEDCLQAILAGKPVGYASGFFNKRYLDINNHLQGLMEKYMDEEPVETEMGEVWTARNDARTFVILGDPAVRLKPESMPK